MNNKELELRVKRLEGVLEELLTELMNIEYAEDIREKLSNLQSIVSDESSLSYYL